MHHHNDHHFLTNHQIGTDYRCCCLLKKMNTQILVPMWTVAKVFWFFFELFPTKQGICDQVFVPEAFVFPYCICVKFQTKKNGMVPACSKNIEVFVKFSIFTYDISPTLANLLVMIVSFARSQNWEENPPTQVCNTLHKVSTNNLDFHTIYSQG